MGSRFLSGGVSGTTAEVLSLLNTGTEPINVSSIINQGLVPNQPVKTNSNKELISGLITTSDINFVALTNPYVGTLTVSDLETDDYKSIDTVLGEFDTQTQNIALTTVAGNTDWGNTNLSGINVATSTILTSGRLNLTQQASMGTPVAGQDIIWSLTTDGRLYTTNPAGTANKITYDADLSSLPYLPLSGGTLSGFLNSQSILPTTTNLYSLGSSSFRFARLWTNEIESGAGSFITLGTNLLTSVAPTQTLTASTAINLNTPTLLKSGVAIATATDLAGKVSRDGTLAMTGNFDVGSFKIVNLGTPTIGTDAVNKTYADLFVPKTGAVVITGGLDTSALAPRTDATFALGSNTFRYTDLHMSGSVQNVAGSNTISMATLNQINITTTALGTSGSFNAVSYKLGGLGATIARSGNAFAGASNLVCGDTSAPTLTNTGSVVFGIGSLVNNSGTTNTCIGNTILANVAASTSAGIVAIGNFACQNLQTGNNNIGIGGNSGVNLTSGSANVMIGTFSCFNMTTGSDNTAIGASAGANGNFSATICLGRQCVSNASNQFVFGSSTAPVNRMIYGDTTNFCDIGSATVAFKDIYTNSTIRNSAGSNIINMTTPDMTLTTTGNMSLAPTGTLTLGGSSATVTNNLVSATLPHAVLYSTTDTTNYPIVFTLAAPTQLITFTSNAGVFATPGFTVGATGILTYTATRTRRVRFTFTSSYAPATNTSSTIRHWFSKNGSTALPTTTTAVVSHTTANADTNVPHSETLNDVIEMATGNTLQLIANYPVAVNTTVNYRNVCFIAQALLD